MNPAAGRVLLVGGESGLSTWTLGRTGLVALDSVRADAHLYLSEGTAAQVYGSGRDDREEGVITVWQIGQTGHISPIDRFPLGRHRACHLSVSRTDSTVVACDYHHGAITTFGPAEYAGHLRQIKTTHFPDRPDRPDPGRQDGSHPHSSSWDLRGRLFVADLGTDRVHVLGQTERPGELDVLHSIPTPDGSGPRDLLLTPSGALWVAGELDGHVYVLPGGVGLTDEPRWHRIPTGGGLLASLATDSRRAVLLTCSRATSELIVIDASTPTRSVRVPCAKGPSQVVAFQDVLVIACHDAEVLDVFDIDTSRLIVNRRQQIHIPRPQCLLVVDNDRDQARCSRWQPQTCN